ncbi:MAG: DUF2306 domain-containing protein [Paracoccaceae bacterium]
MPRALNLLIWIGALSVALVSYRVLIAPIDLVMQHMAHYAASAPVAMWGHILFGPLALAIVPFQFHAGLRRGRPALHRWMGRVYALSVAVAALSSLALLPQFQGQGWVGAGFGMLAILWIATTALAVVAARRRDFVQHRRWMLRSAALCFAAVSLRIIMAPLMAMGWSVVETYQVTAWGSWLLTLGAVEWWMRR